MYFWGIFSLLLNYSSFPIQKCSPHIFITAAHTGRLFLHTFRGEFTHRLRALTGCIPRRRCSVKTNCCCRRQIRVGGGVFRVSEALKHNVNISDLINTETWEVINALLSRRRNSPDVSIMRSYHLEAAVWQGSGNCPTVTVHLSPFLDITIQAGH